MAKNFLWFAEADVATSNEALLMPVDKYLGCDPVSGGIVLHFEDVEGAATREVITLNCANGNQKAVLNALVSIMNSHPHSDGFIVVADANVANGQTATFHKAFGGLVTGCAIA
jgi:hypothetical protein|tara:strand:+ start:149 stop:487 length:339 start_codon:yes stop_codon:yes gene_type:complete